MIAVDGNERVMFAAATPVKCNSVSGSSSRSTSPSSAGLSFIPTPRSATAAAGPGPGPGNRGSITEKHINGARYCNKLFRAPRLLVLNKVAACNLQPNLILALTMLANIIFEGND